MLQVMYTIVFICTTFLLLIGIIRLIEMFWQSVRSYQSKIIIVPIGGHVDDIEIFIRSLISRAVGSKFGFVENIIIADMGADEETAEICKNLESQYDFIYFCEGREISEKLQEKLYI